MESASILLPCCLNALLLTVEVKEERMRSFLMYHFYPLLLRTSHMAPTYLHGRLGGIVFYVHREERRTALIPESQNVKTRRVC